MTVAAAALHTVRQGSTNICSQTAMAPNIFKVIVLTVLM